MWFKRLLSRRVMFSYKSLSDSKIRWFNLDQVVMIDRWKGDNNHLFITLVSGVTVVLAHNWQGRNDVERFKKAIGGLEVE